MAQKLSDAWPSIPTEQLAIKSVPGNPGANAIQLYFEYFKDDNNKFITVHRRIKVLTDAGRKYADVEIPLEPGESLKKLQARTMRPDGTSVEFSGKPFQKLLFKKRGAGKYIAETFTLAEASAGSTIEYRYLISLPLHVVDQISSWPMQSELYTVKEILRFRPFQGMVDIPIERGRAISKTQVSYAYLNQVKAATPEKKKDNVMELELDNVAPFAAEAYMPPEEDYQPAILFFYGGRETASPDQYWGRWGKLISESAENFIGNFGAIRGKAQEISGNESDAEKKLQKLYAFAQSLRNLSYERERSNHEVKAEGIKDNRNAVDVLLHGYGTSADINRLFVALARAAGFTANELLVSRRIDRSFSKLVLSFAQLENDAVEVRTNSKTLVVDPGTRYCPFGLLRWQETGVQALKLTAQGAEFVTTPVAQKSKIRRTVTSELLNGGNLRGEISLEVEGPDALERRLEALKTDENGRRQSLESELLSRLPEGSIVKLADSVGWDSPTGPLKARFSLDIPNFAASTSKRLVAPSLLLQSPQKEMFNSDFRRFPISLPYPFDEEDDVEMKLPQGYEIEVLPYRRKSSLTYASYETNSMLENELLVTHRKLNLDVNWLPPEQFGELKGFFNIVLAGDSGHGILRHSEADGEANSSR